MIPGVFELTRVDGMFAALLAEPLAELVGARVFAHQAPDELPPAPDDAPDHLLEARVVWTLSTPTADGRVILAGPESRVTAGALYAVKAVAPVAAPSDLEAVVDAFDGALHGATALVPDSELRAVIRRTSPLLYPELVDGRLWWHVGGLYAITITNA